MSEPAVPSSLGRYRVLGTIGSGGMGVVLRAFDPKLAREVAVKLLARELAQQPETVQRLRREAVAIARLSHPNIVRVFDSGEQDGIPFYVMELLAGVGLDVRASREPVAAPPGFDSKEFLALFTPLADALAAVHEAKLVHRDVKPSNVMTGVPERGPVLTDFGIAWIEGREGLTQAGMVMGTALYMSPERMRGRPADAMGDLYGLGQCMIEFATGRVVCSEVPRSELMRRRLTAEPPPLTTLAPEMPPVLAAIADRCSRLLPSDRFGSARELHAALKRAATDLGLGPRAPSARVSQQRELSRAPEIPPGRRRFPAIAAAAALLAVAVLLAWMRADSGRAERSPWSGPTADASRSAKPPSGPPVGRPRETRPVANQAIRDAPQPGRGVQSVTLTSASEQGHRVGLAASGTGSLLAAWVEPD
ncbi:MAG: serine/threonine protein kinase [Candidatus Wallbacteria bacterium]|nr:serine/threonine protein kinase [Candidatus Wallbacteria bacterium]